MFVIRMRLDYSRSVYHPSNDLLRPEALTINNGLFDFMLALLAWLAAAPAAGFCPGPETQSDHGRALGSLAQRRQEAAAQYTPLLVRQF